MIDETYKPKPGRLSDRDITFLCIGDKPMIEPFVSAQAGRPSFGLSSAGYDFKLSDEYMVQDNYGEESGSVVDPLNSETHRWIKKKATNNEIIIGPGECILASTVEYMRMPDDVQAIVLGKSSLARCNIICNATPLENGWEGTVTLEITNCDPTNSVKLYVNQGIAQCLFDRMANVPDKTYTNRSVGGAYQGQRGPTPSR